MMVNIYMLSDAELVKRIAVRLKELRLKQNISRQDLSSSSGVSTSTIARIESGEIKSFDSVLRILRTLGKLDIFQSLVEEEELSPSEYYRLVHSVKTKTRKRATKSTHKPAKEESEW